MKKIWILTYGTSENFESEKLLATAKHNGLEAELLQPKYFDIIVNKSSSKSIRYKSQRIDMPNLVLTRTGSATNYFTAALYRQIEKFNIPVINTADSILTVKDKLLTSQVLAKSNLPTPKTMLMNFPVDCDLVESEIGFPCVVKLVSGSKGKGIYLCQSKKFFNELMALVDNLKSRKSMIIQEYMDHAVGSDLRVWVIGGKTVFAMKRTAPEGDFRANISNGGTGESFEITEEIDFLARETARVMGLDIAGVDLLFDHDGFKICEANSSPGFEGIDQYCGTDMAQRIIDYVKLKIQ
jgi:glutathione synthase/RimK-type ligase-like ATP-grasp enzyme